MLTAADRIRELIKQAESIPIRDGANIITPAGIDAVVERRTLAQCLRIAVEQELVVQEFLKERGIEY